MKLKRLRLILIMIVPLLLLVGCAPTSPATVDSSLTASETPTATSDTQQSACQALAKIDDALARLSNAGNNITVGEVKKIQAGIGAALNVASRLAPEDASSTIDQIRTANDQVGQSVADLPNDDTLGQHSPQLQQFKEQVAKARSAASQLATELNCNG